MLNYEEVRAIVKEVVSECRYEVDHEIDKLHDKIVVEHAWTEERANDIAEKAADLAVRKITDNFYMSVGKKTLVVLGAAVAGLVIFLKDEIHRWLTR